MKHTTGDGESTGCTARLTSPIQENSHEAYPPEDEGELQDFTSWLKQQGLHNEGVPIKGTPEA